MCRVPGYFHGATTAISAPAAVPVGVDGGGGDVSMVVVVVVNSK